MTEEELISLGLFCETLLAQDQFAELVRQFDLQCYDHMMATAPHELKKRESIYAQRSGVRDFIGHLKAVVEQKDDIVKKMMEPPLDEGAPIDRFEID